MPIFRARYISHDGAVCSGDIEAQDIGSVGAAVAARWNGHLVTAGPRRGSASPRARSRMPAADLLASLDSLELMLVSGVRINAAVQALAANSRQRLARGVWSEVGRRLEANGGFAQALGELPHAFDPALAGIIRAHEAAGSLAEGVALAREHAALMLEVRREALRAGAYPVTVAVAGLACSALMCRFTLPRFARMLEDVGVETSNPVTRFFFALSAEATGHPALCAMVPLVPAAAVWAATRRRVRPLMDRCLVWIPVVRGAVEAVCMARMCATFGALSRSGIRVVEALEHCAQAVGNSVYSEALRRAVESVRSNATVGEALGRERMFPHEFVLAVRSSEGCLPDVFSRLARYYRGEARHRVGLALRLLEPAMLVAVLAWVFAIALAVVLPVVEVLNAVH